MAERTIEFGALHLLDDAEVAHAQLAGRLDLTEVGCLAPGEEGSFVPGFLVVNYLLGVATFRGFKVARRQAIYRRIFQAPLLAGVAGVLSVLIGFIIYMGDDISYSGLFDVSLVPLGL
jgi:hypothetical protein